MKKFITMLAVGAAIVSSASADLTTFSWSGGTKDSVTTGQYIHTLLDTDATADIWNYVSGGTIDIADLGLFTPFNSQQASVAAGGPPAVVGKWGTTDAIVGDGSIAGEYAYAIAANASMWGGIVVGDTLTIFNTAGPINELQSDQSQPPAAGQIFAPSNPQSVNVVPEPATFGLFGLGALSAWIIRRNKRKAQQSEEEA